ncbi:peptidoglycan recognition protein-lc [Culex quinquefasciatus]|uniref:Peptidoglycan recognition protein-lc n=1 Tax=Culex quinquefasciatus TaxID=7176 RepID=B0WH92_CULQU|nr:peptidoglycan recognition protein-lc [Culex quinquefasciatus]|eukprot:XP_001848057.1 peptidoglycan recognition protein-lc [Culex quinquefasciatus]
MVQQIMAKQSFKEANEEASISKCETSTSSTKFMKIILVLSLTSIVISLASMVCVLTLAKSDHGQNQDVIPEDTATFAPKSKALRIVTRNEWLAQPPRERLDDLKLPVNKVIISHTTTEECNTQSACLYRVRFIQNHHIGAENYGDIGYNFLIGGDGNVYEGRGWLKVGAFVRGQNSKSIGITFIGDYRQEAPSQVQMEMMDALLASGIKSGHLTQDYRLYGSCQFMPTESPGRLLYAELKKHSHWSEELD